MDDAEYTLYQEIKDKKKTATGAFHKKGSKSKKCTFYHETLKGKEKKEYMQSTTETMNLLNADYKGNFFKLPPDKQKLQLNFLLERYHYKTACISEFFSIAKNTTWRILDQHGLMTKVKSNTVSMTRSEYESLINKAKADRAAFYSTTEENSPEPSIEISNDTPIDTSVSETASNPSVNAPVNDLKFLFEMNTELTGKTLGKRFYGLSKAMDEEGHYRVKVTIEEV